MPLRRHRCGSTLLFTSLSHPVERAWHVLVSCVASVIVFGASLKAGSRSCWAQSSEGHYSKLDFNSMLQWSAACQLPSREEGSCF